MGKRLDLDDLADIESPDFLTILAEAPTKVRNSQLSQYFAILIDDLYGAKERFLKTAIMKALCKTIYLSEDSLNVFVQEKFIKEIEISDLTLNLFYLLAEKAPEALNCMNFEISEAVMLYPKYILFIIALYCKSFEEINDPWPITDLLLEHLVSFRDKELAEDYVSLLAYLVTVSSDFRSARGQACWDAICNVMKVKSENIVHRCYAALTQIADVMPDVSNFPVELVCKHLHKTDLQRSCISLLLHATPCNVTIELISALFAAARTELRSTLVLMKLSSSRQVSKLILSNSEWMLWNLPTQIDTVRLFAVLLNNRMLRTSIASKQETPQFLMNLMDLKSAQSLNAVCTFLRRLPLDEGFIKKLSECGFFTKYFSMSLSSENVGVVQSGLVVVHTIAALMYIDEFKQVIKRVLQLVRDQGTLMSIALKVGLSLCRYRQCAMIFKRDDFEKDLRRIRRQKNMTTIAAKFLQALTID